MYLMRPTGNPQVIRHPQHLNLDPQGPVATGDLDPQVTLPAGYLCGPAPVSSPTQTCTHTHGMGMVGREQKNK